MFTDLYPFSPVVSESLRLDLFLAHDDDDFPPHVETGYLDNRHLPEGHPDKDSNICQHCDRQDHIAHGDLCMACIANGL